MLRICYLDPGLCKADLHRQILPGKHVRIVSLEIRTINQSINKH